MAVVFIVMLVGSFLIFVIDYLLLSKRLRDNRELYRRIREGIDGPVEGLLLDSHIKLLKADWVLSERKSNDHLASVTRATVEWDVKQAPNDFTPDVKRDVITKVARHLGLSSLCVTFSAVPENKYSGDLAKAEESVRQLGYAHVAVVIPGDDDKIRFQRDCLPADLISIPKRPSSNHSSLLPRLHPLQPPLLPW